MNHARRLVCSSSSFLRLFTPVPSSRYLNPALGIRFASRWNPASHPPKHKPPPRKPLEIPPDPRDEIEGWPEYKEELLKRCKTPEERNFVHELTPEEVLTLLHPEIDLKRMREEEDSDLTFKRPRPVNKNYFSSDPFAEQFLQDVEKVYEQYRHLPKAPAHLWPLREWKVAGAGILGRTEMDPNEHHVVGDSKTRRIMIEYAKELNSIHPVLQPPELRKWLNDFAPIKKKVTQGFRQFRSLDKYQQSKGSGKRKTSRAAARIVPGEGLVYVNGKIAGEFFTRLRDVQNVVWPLQVLNVVGKYNVWVTCWGGGTTGTSITKIESNFL